MRCALLIVSGVIAGAMCSSALAGPGGADTWFEDGEAGELLPSAQVPFGTGPLHRVLGTFGGFEDVDLYKVHIADPGSFEAVAIGSTQVDQRGGSVPLDTQLWLFDSTGHGVTFNDDDGLNARSRITGQFLIGPGDYYIAVSLFDYDALNPDGFEIWLDEPFTTERAPDGEGGVLTSWGIGVVNRGDPSSALEYQLDLRGVTFAGRVIPLPSGASLALGGLCAAGLVRGRRWHR